MKTKDADVPYCGVCAEKIKNANPVLDIDELKIHHLYLTERHEIYKRKEILKLPRSEWTNDDVFKTYRFTNVRRELDRESKWLINNIVNTDMSLSDKMLWCVLFRLFNKSETIERLDILGKIDLSNISNDDIDSIRQKVQDIQNTDKTFNAFTGAFFVSGLSRAWATPGSGLIPPASGKRLVDLVDAGGNHYKTLPYNDAVKVMRSTDYVIKGFESCSPTRMFHLIKWVTDKRVIQSVLRSHNQFYAYSALLTIPGISRFLAYQIFVDFTYIPEFKFSENEFTVSGPGCSRGVDLLFKDRDGMTHEECIFWMRDNIQRLWEENGLRYYPDELFDHLPEYDRYYNVMMLENSFCEHSKSSKARKGTGRPRNSYTPTEPTDTNDVKKRNRLF